MKGPPEELRERMQKLAEMSVSLAILAHDQDPGEFDELMTDLWEVVGFHQAQVKEGGG